MEAKDICVMNISNPVNVSIEVDEYVDYRDGYESCFEGSNIVKRCNSWHSLSAVLGTEFFVYGKPGWEGVYRYKGVILLVNRDLKHVEPLLKKLKLMGKKVAVGFHENLADFLLYPQQHGLDWLPQLQNLVNQSDAYLNVMIYSSLLFKGLFSKPVWNIPHATPYTEWNHGFTVPVYKREGIIVVTRTFNQRLPRNTLAALVVASRLAEVYNTFVTFVAEDGFDMDVYLKSLGLNNINVIKGPLSYTDWLKTIARHKVAFHYDMVGTLGQCVSDAALVDVVCVGGNSDYNLETSLTGTSCLDDSVRILDDFYADGIFDEFGRSYKSALVRVKRFTSSKHVRECILCDFNSLE